MSPAGLLHCYPYMEYIVPFSEGMTAAAGVGPQKRFRSELRSPKQREGSTTKETLMRSLIAPFALSAMFMLVGTALAHEDENVLARFIEYMKAGNQAEIVKIADKVVPAAEQVLADSPEI